jgi:hemimethylated DNA binding protein
MAEMQDPKQLPYLINLLDDDSEVVRAELGKNFNGWGEQLKTELARLSEPPTHAQRHSIQSLMSPYSRIWLKSHWQQWMEEGNEVLGLEKALSMLSEFQTGFVYPGDLSLMLDDLATLAKEAKLGSSARDLAQFLFKDLGLKGAQSDYNNPLNSGLVYVIKEKRGIPISLACVYILTGARLGLHIEGCNFPGHFLARAVENGEATLVDCFNAGAVVDHKVVASMSEQTPWDIQHLIQQAAPARAIVTRVLGNLARAYQDAGATEDALLMAELSNAIEKDALEHSGVQADERSLLLGQPRFRTGDIVMAPKLGWRGVIVDFDLSCKAPEAWYLAHGIDARKNQPWYHIFLNNSQQVGYAAEESLLLDSSGEKVYHPLVPHFFEKFENGRFVRNHRAWPGTL